MTNHNQRTLQDIDDSAALRMIVAGTATETGQRFFCSLVENLARVLGTHGAWVTEYLADQRRLRALAFWLGGEFVEHYEYDIDGTPCEPVIQELRLVHVPDQVLKLYPHDTDLQDMAAVSYLGVPLFDVDGHVLGHLAVLDTKVLPEEPRILNLFRIFAARAAAELQRLRAEAEVYEREQKLSRLINGAMDAIIELNRDLRINRINQAAAKVLGRVGSQFIGADFQSLLTEESGGKLRDLIAKLDRQTGKERYLWIPGGLTISNRNDLTVPVEATLSFFAMDGEHYYALILRDVNDRLQAEAKIHSLMAETEYLREEIRELRHFDEIIGQSKPIVKLLNQVQQVAETDATVLISGETGTGKELIARAIHRGSKRRDKALIKVNCAAIPGNLMESEFFGHEPGAFTGATKRREGRFALADGGTIFLDEVGELPLDLQAKLLRVLQEGEFDPVGSARARKVDIRTIAATNRDLIRAVQDGKFREDLYYRLNVFPVSVPPLRERGDDIILLAKAFAEAVAKRMGRQIRPFPDDYDTRLKAYHWPGNIRELQNIIERAVITSRDGHLNLGDVLPYRGNGSGLSETPDTAQTELRVRTAAELRQLERDNIVAALETTGWQVSGDSGAARLLGMNSSTLSSRIKALHIERPR
jgi:PAS domain S-box-containing protein